MNDDKKLALIAYEEASIWCFETSIKCFLASVALAIVHVFVVSDVVWGLAALAWVVSIAWAVFCLCFCVLYLMEEVCDR